MKTVPKRFGATKGVIALLVLVVVCLAGWYAWNSYSNKTNIPPGWTTYNNRNLGISFAYPNTWTFIDKTTSTLYGQYYIGELTSGDKTILASMKLTRKQDGQVVYSTIADWEAQAQKIGITYSNLTAVKTNYTAFSYAFDAGGTTGLGYKILSPTKNVEIVVLPAQDSSIVEQVLATLRFDP